MHTYTYKHIEYTRMIWKMFEGSLIDINNPRRIQTPPSNTVGCFGWSSDPILRIGFDQHFSITPFLGHIWILTNHEEALTNRMKDRGGWDLNHLKKYGCSVLFSDAYMNKPSFCWKENLSWHVLFVWRLWRCTKPKNETGVRVCGHGYNIKKRTNKQTTCYFLNSKNSLEQKQVPFECKHNILMIADITFNVINWTSLPRTAVNLPNTAWWLRFKNCPTNRHMCNFSWCEFSPKQVRQIALSCELVVNDGGFLGISLWKGLSLGDMPRIGSTTNINYQHPLNERRNHMVTPPKFNSEWKPQKNHGKLEDDPASFWGPRPNFQGKTRC